MRPTVPTEQLQFFLGTPCTALQEDELALLSALTR